jgi:hypothetical protein
MYLFWDLRLLLYLFVKILCGLKFYVV